MAVINEQEYDFLMNTAGELMLVFYGLDPEPSHPKISLTRDGVVLTRSPETPQICMNDIPAEIAAQLTKIAKVLVCEIDEDGEFKHVYDAEVVKAQSSSGVV